jgi:solute:Na+ symporter, SSS family
MSLGDASPSSSPADGVYSSGMKTGFLLAIGAYAAALGLAGLGLRRRPGSLESFFLASRRLGAGRVAFSLCASWIGAASLLVSVDEACRDGARAIWIVGLPAVATLLVLTALTRPVRAAAGLTPSELMRDRYGRAAGTLTSVLVVWYMTVLAASQLAAAGPFLGSVLGTGPLPSLAAAAGVVMLYSAAGGLRALARTHVLQFFLLVAGVAAMAVSLASRTSWSAVRTAASAAGQSSYFDPLSGGSRGPLIALSFLLAWTVSPIAWQRMQAARGDAASRRGTVLAAVLLGSFYAGIVAVGMLFRPLGPDSGTGVPLVTRFVMGGSGPVLGGLVFVTVLAAIFSTLDAALNAGAFTLTKDILGPKQAPGTERRSLALARTVTVLLALAALVVAARLGDILKTLGLASAIMAEGLLVPGLAALFLKERAPLAGLLGLSLGGGYALAAFLSDAGLGIVRLPAWPKSVPLGVALGAAGFLAGLVIERRRRPSPPPALDISP